MKLTTLPTALFAFVFAVAVAVTTATAAPCADKPVPWEQVTNKDATRWAFYSQPKGTDLTTVKPKYHECYVSTPSNKDYVFKSVFENNSDFEFQTVQDNVLAANCINCSPPVLGNYYTVKIDAYITCDMYEDTPIPHANAQ